MGRLAKSLLVAGIFSLAGGPLWHLNYLDGLWPGRRDGDEPIMPVLKTYRGKPITRIKRLGEKLQITYANRSSGDRHRRAVITRREWEKHGASQFVDDMPDLRVLATRPTGNKH